MSRKSIPISVRITPADANFLAQLTVEGAVTPSEKVRALITQARREHSRRWTYPESVAHLRETSADTRNLVDAAERRLDVHSELLHDIMDWLPEAMAGLTSAWTEGAGEGEMSGELELADLVRLERLLVNRLIRSFEALMRMAVTSSCPAYDPSVIDDRLDSLMELSEIVRQRRQHNRNPGHQQA